MTDTEPTITVYVSTDVDSPAIHDENDMQTMYDNLLNEVYPAINIGHVDYDPSTVLKSVDPIAYRCGLADYTASGDWVEASMPLDLWVRDLDDDDVVAWIAKTLSA